MATYFVSSAGSNTAPYDTEAKAATTLGTIQAVPWTAADTVKISSTHTETTGVTTTYTFPTAQGMRLISVLFNGSGTGAATAGASVGIGAASVVLTLGGSAYIYGVTFNGGTNNNNACDFTIGLSTVTSSIVFDACTINVPSVATGAILSIGQANVSGNEDNYFRFVNCTYNSGANKSITIRTCKVIFENLTLTGTAPTTLFNKTASTSFDMEIVASDLSGVTWTNLIDVSLINFYSLRLRQCKLPASFSVVTGSMTAPGKEVILIDCNSGDVNYYYSKTTFQGTVLASNAVYYNAGDGSDSISWLMTSSANATFYNPLESQDIMFHNSTLSSMTTTVECTNDGTTFTDAELWQETTYKGTAGTPIATINSGDRAANILSTGTNQDSSSVSWTGTGGFGAEVKQKLVSTSFTPAEVGVISVSVYLAKASSSVYVSPKVLSTSAKQWQDSLSYINEGAGSSSGGGGPVVGPGKIVRS